MLGGNYLAVILEGVRNPSSFGAETSVNMSTEEGKRKELPDTRRPRKRRQERQAEYHSSRSTTRSPTL
jgi:hypothetical protein